MFDHKLKETIKQEPAATGLLSPSKLTKGIRHGGSAASNKSMKKSGDGQDKAINMRSYYSCVMAGETRRSKTLFSVTKLTTEPDKVNNKETDASIKDKDSALNQSRQSLNMKLPSPKKPKE